MRIILLAAALALAAVSALPKSDNVVAENTMENTAVPGVERTDWDEAADTISLMQGQGQNADACADLAKTAENEVIDSIKQEQSTLDAMDKGKKCNGTGQAVVDSANSAKQKADDESAAAATAVAKAEKAPVDFAPVKFSTLKKGKCDSFFNTQSYRDALAKLTAAKEEANRRTGSATGAAKALAAAIQSQKEAINACKCQIKSLVDKAFAIATAAATSLSNKKAWNKAHSMRCMLAGKTADNCPVKPMPTVTRPTLPADVEAAKC